VTAWWPCCDEASQHIPFEIKRIYYIFDAKDIPAVFMPIKTTSGCILYKGKMQNDFG
jgi:hypothetical protein